MLGFNLGAGDTAQQNRKKKHLIKIKVEIKTCKKKEK